MYGLGSLVKKATRGIKKIVKSPIGKAALLGGLGWAANAGMLPGGMGAGWWGKMKGLGTGIGTGGLGKWFGKLTPGQKIFTGLAGAGIAAPFVQKALGWGPYKPEEEVEEEDWTVTPSSILNLRNQARDYYTAATPDYIGSPFMPNKQYVMPNFYAAKGGRAGLLNGGGAGEAQLEQMLRAEYLKYKNKGGTMPYEQFKILVMKQAQQGQMPNQMMADGGRIGFWPGGPAGGASAGGDYGGNVNPQQEYAGKTFQETYGDGGGGGSGNNTPVVSVVKDPPKAWDEGYVRKINWKNMFPGGKPWVTYGLPDEDESGTTTQSNLIDEAIYGGSQIDKYKGNKPLDSLGGLTYNDYLAKNFNAGGRVRAQEGGLMDLGGQEKDYRDEGGFVALGGEERADDVPARLSKNEFVFTADAVRAAGGGDIDKGSEVMQNVMDNLEQGGEVSEDSQGLGGGEEIMSEEIIDESNPAQGMYDNYEQLQSRVA